MMFLRETCLQEPFGALLFCPFERRLPWVLHMAKAGLLRRLCALRPALTILTAELTATTRNAEAVTTTGRAGKTDSATLKSAPTPPADSLFFRRPIPLQEVMP